MLKRKVFFVLWSCVKMFYSVYYQSQVHSRYFCLTVKLENIPWRLLVTTIYICCTSIIHLRGNIFCFMVWLENILQFIFLGYQAAMVLKLWYGACLLIYISCLCIYYFLHYALFIFLISILIVIYSWLCYTVKKILHCKIFFSVY